MADDTQLSAAVGVGDKVRDLDDGTRKWPVAVACYVTGGSAGAWTLQAVDASHGLPVAQQGTWTVAVSGSVAVTGTFWQATQPISGTVTANAGSGTFAVSAAALPLPSGAAADSSVNGILLAQSSTTSGQSGPLVQGAVTTAAPTYTTAKTAPLSLTTAGALRVDASATTQPVSIAAHVTVDAGTNTSTAALALETGGNLASVATALGATADAIVAAGASGTISAKLRRATQGLEDLKTLIVLAAGSNVIGAVTQSGTWNVGTVTTVSAVTSITNTVTVQGGAASGASASGNPVQLGGVFNTTQPTVTTGQAVQLQSTNRGELLVGVGVSGFAVTQSGTWNVGTVTTVTTVSAVTAITNALPAGSNTIGAVTQASGPWTVTQTPATSGGCSIGGGITSGAANQDQTSVKGSAGQIFGYAAFNTTASARYLKVYNKSAPTSADTPILRIYLPATGGANVDIPNGIACATAIGYRVTTGAGDSDTGACSTNDCLINIWYK